MDLAGQLKLAQKRKDVGRGQRERERVVLEKGTKGGLVLVTC